MMDAATCNHKPVSIGLPFYNAEECLSWAIRSIFAQTYEEWELILVDDGSTDRSLEIARSVRDPRVRVLSDGMNKKLPRRLNEITATSQFDFVARMDADDLISPRRLEKQMSVLEEHPEVDLVTTGIVAISGDQRPLGVRHASPDYKLTGRDLLGGHNLICHAAILGRKEWFVRNPYGDSPRGQDVELWVRAYSKNDLRIHFLEDTLYYYWESNKLDAGKLLGDYALQRDSYRRFGPLWFSPWEIGLLRAKTYAKGFIVRFLDAANKLDVLLKRRNMSIQSVEVLNGFNREIEQIMQTRVPGLDD